MAGGGQQPRPRHVPQRTCVACRQERAKRDLVRVVRTPAGGVQVDPGGKQSGRGAYLCLSEQCWSAGLKGSLLPRALKMDEIPQEDLQHLSEYAARLIATPH